MNLPNHSDPEVGSGPFNKPSSQDTMVALDGLFSLVRQGNPDRLIHMGPRQEKEIFDGIQSYWFRIQ
jgi:hypothetical protein